MVFAGRKEALHLTEQCRMDSEVHSPNNGRYFAVVSASFCSRLAINHRKTYWSCMLFCLIASGLEVSLYRPFLEHPGRADLPKDNTTD